MLGWVGGVPMPVATTNLNLNTMLQLQAYTSATSNFTEHETIAAWSGPDAIISFASARNLKDLTKNVSVRIQKGSDNFFISCSAPLSDLVRAGKVDIGHIVGFKIATTINEDGEERTFIHAPTAAPAGQRVGDIKMKVFTPESVFSPEGTIVLG
jgi:hypothetical protein